MCKSNQKQFKSRFLRVLASLALCLGLFTPAFAQNGTVTGKVTDGDGNALVGVFVTIEGTTTGTATDLDGTYSIKASKGQTLVFSCVGFRSQEIALGAQAKVNVTLEDDMTSLDDAVVVAYGVQKRRDIVGAVENLSTKDIEDRTSSSMNIGRALQGTIPGLSLSFSDGQPNRDATVQIRGTVNSIGSGGSALVLIDGIEGDLNSVNPDDIESVTVLKDASSTAVYGSRGTFGVILLTTKSATKGQARLNYSGAFNIYRRTITPQHVTNGYDWTTSFLESYIARSGSDPANINNVFKFSRDWYAELERRNNDPTADRWRVNDANGRYEYFGNTDWYSIIFKDYSTGHTHNLSISGGNDTASYIVSGRYFSQDGIYNAGDEKYEQFNVRAKGQVNLRPWLKFESSIDYTYRKSHQPMAYTGLGDTPVNINRMLNHQGYPMTLEKNPDGSWTNAAVYLGWAGFVEGNSWRERTSASIKNLNTLTIDIIKDVLVLRGNFAYYNANGDMLQTCVPYYYSDGPGLSQGKRPSDSYYLQKPWNRQRISADATITFTPNLGKNNHLTVLAGWNIEDFKYSASRFKRQGLLMDDRPNWDLVSGESMEMEDAGSMAYALNGFFGRVSYSYKGKYLAEVSGRYDGNSKFPSSQRWGFFPSASVGWRISEEGFLKEARWLDNLKIRVSAGTAGNGLISNAYAYMSTMSLNTSSVLNNGAKFTYTSAPSPIPDGLTWEKATTYDLGVDFEALNGRLNFVADIYRKNTTDMYVTGDELPAVYGNDAPKGNYANMKTDGWELSLGWRDSHKVGGKTLSYNVKATLYDAMSTITKYTSKTNLLPTLYETHYYEGMTIGEIWGYVADGFYATDEDAQSWGLTTQFANSKWKPGMGDIRYVDQNGDHVINQGDGTLDNHGDLVKIGNSTPRYNYSLNLGVKWNGIGISMMWTGVGHQDWYPAKESGWFWGQYGRPYSMALPWHSDRAVVNGEFNPDAYWPRLVGYSGSSASGILSSPNTQYLQNAAFLRLKNLTLEYSLPKKVTDAIKMQNVRVYISGENLLTFTPLSEHACNYDPEGLYHGDADSGYGVGADNGGDGDIYPVMKSYTFGINITF